MEKKLEVLVFVLIVIIITLGAWIYSLTKKNSSLTQLAAGFNNGLNTLEQAIGRFEEILAAPDARQRLQNLFVDIDGRCDRDELSAIQRNVWALSRGTLVSVYVLLFESDFSKLSEKATIEQLVNFTTSPMSLESYMDTHLEFTVKSMNIIKSSIANARSYSQLNDMVTLLKGWPPFAYWGTDIFKWVEEKAVALSEKDLKTNRNNLLEQFQITQWSEGKANNLEKFFDAGVEILKRELYSEEARERFKKFYTGDLKRVLTTLGEHTAGSNTIAQKLLRLNKVWNEELEMNRIAAG